MSAMIEPMLAVRMGFLEVGEPLWLIALVLLLPVVYFWKTSRVHASAVRKISSLVLRIGLMLALILALADTHLVWEHKGICVVFLVDQSQSVPEDARKAIRGALQEQIKTMTADDEFAVIEFAGDAVLESLPSHKGDFPPPVEVGETARTDIARALRLAMATFPPDMQKRVVLLSDGNQNSGDALKEARIAAANDVDVATVLVHADTAHEVMVDQIIAPTRVQKDQRLNVRAIISADQAQHAQLLIFRDNVQLPTQDVELKAGTNVFDVPDSIATGGFHDYEITVIPSGADTFPENNSGHAFTQVDAPGKVLVIEGNPSQHDYLADALEANLVQVETGTESKLPGDLRGFMQYDAIVLEDVNRFRLSESQMEWLEKWVKDFGGGLVLVGGTDSFGAGGYKGTALERVSPVDMDVKRKKHMASLAIVIVADKSGSMAMPVAGGKQKMELADAGAVETIKLLDASDEAQVGAVDTETEWMVGEKMVRMTPGNKREMMENTEAVRAGGGGIYCKTALVDAYHLITGKSCTAMSKHVIMFADAQDSEQQNDCVDLARKYFRDYGVTTTVIGMGTDKDPDVQFQRDVAEAGHGRAYLTDNVLELPRFFAKDTFLVSRPAYVEKPDGFTPTLYQSPLLAGILKSGVPKLYGYVGTTLKPRATLAMHGVEADDPLLAHWEIGLGKCVAFTSDATTKWSADWVRWEGFAKFWTQTVRWVSRSVGNSLLTTSTTIEGTDGRVVTTAVDPTGRPVNNLNLQTTVAPPEHERSSMSVPMVQVSPGRYEAKFPVSAKGSYLVNIVDGQSGQALDVSGAVLSYPVEFRDLNPNAGLLHAIADTTGGQFLTALDGLFAPKAKMVLTFKQLWEMLLVFGAAALLFDIAIRRLNVGDWFNRRPQGVVALAPAGATLGAFKNIKTGKREATEQRQSLREKLAAAGANAVKGEAAVRPVITAPTGERPVEVTQASEEKAKEAGYTGSLMSAKRRAAAQIQDKSQENQ